MSVGNNNPESSWGDTATFYQSSGVSSEQRELTRQTLDSFMKALKIQDTDGIQKTKTMSLWCKQCGHEFTLGRSAVNKELECFQLLCPSCRGMVLQIRTNNTTALRFLARQFAVLSQPSDEMADYQEEIGHCIWAFQQHDYQRCIDLAVPLMRVSTFSCLAQLLIISAQRLGMTKLVEKTAQMALGPTADHSPWEAVLLKLTLGIVGYEEAMKVARSDADRCRVQFYTAVRLITYGEKRKAKNILNRCLKFDVNNIEYSLTSSELELT